MVADGSAVEDGLSPVRSIGIRGPRLRQWPLIGGTVSYLRSCNPLYLHCLNDVLGSYVSQSFVLLPPWRLFYLFIPGKTRVVAQVGYSVAFRGSELFSPIR